MTIDIGALKAATVVHKLRSIRENNQRLRDALDAADPERLADLEALFKDREVYLQESEHSDEAA